MIPKLGYHILAGLILLPMVAGCTGEPVVPISDLTTPKNRSTPRVVESGDTLYLIAWESGLDYRELADWNGLSPPYRLKSGNRIRLTPPRGDQNSPSNKDNELQETLATTSLIPPTNSVVVTEIVPTGSVSEGEGGSASSRVAHWLWPADGTVIQPFTGRDGNNGLDISGEEGSTIRAAARGIVVYAGSGLRGYGRLLIIQHNDEFLSAYAHNRILLVQEGAVVELGQVIAEMGNTDAKTTRLHFEIRRDGKPVNPLKYLPKQSS